MDRDRWSYLAVRAYYGKVLTFKQEERLDSRWSLREEILLAEVERDVLLKLHEIVHQAESAAAQYVSQSTFEHHYNAAKQQYNSIVKLGYPFSNGAGSGSKNTFEQLAEAWKKQFGDPNSEQVKQDIAAMRELRKK